MVFVHWILRRNYFVASLSTMIYRCIIYILMYNMSTKSYYWWSYGSAKFCFETSHRIIKFRRAITSSISIRWRQFLYWNVSHDPLYRHCDLEVSKQRGRESRHDIVAWCKISHVYIHNTLTSPKHNIIPIFFNFMIAHVSISYRSNYCVQSLRE